MALGMLDISHPPTLRAPSGSARSTRSKPAADGDRFSLPSDGGKAGPGRRASSDPGPKTSLDVPQRGDATPAEPGRQLGDAERASSAGADAPDAPADPDRKAAAIDDIAGTDIEDAKGKLAAPPPESAGTTAAAPSPAVMREPGFLAVMQALGVPVGKSTGTTEGKAAPKETAIVPPSPGAAGAPDDAAIGQVVAPPATTKADGKIETASIASEAGQGLSADEPAAEAEEARADAEIAPQGVAMTTGMPILPPQAPPEAAAPPPSPPAAPDTKSGRQTAATGSIAEQGRASFPAAAPKDASEPATSPAEGKPVTPDAASGKAASATAPESKEQRKSFGEHLAKATTELAQAQPGTIGTNGAPIEPSGFGALAPASGHYGVPSAHAATSSATTHPVVSGVPIAAVPVEIGMKSLQGVNRFDIRLDPEDLGQIDVRLDISETGSVRAHIVVDRPEALASLQRETTHLERALEQAGFKTDDGVSLSLRQQGQGEAGNGRSEGREARSGHDPATMADTDPTATTPPVQRVAWTRASGIDRHI